MTGMAGRIALVTGAGNGIGRAIARRLAQSGAHVWVTDIDQAAATSAAAEITAGGGVATAAVMDVTRGQDVTATMRAIKQAHGKLDILVSNAGINVRADFRHLTDAEWAQIREVNLDGVVRLARDGFELLRHSGKGVLVHVSSILARRHVRQLAAYSATKGAVTALTRSLAIEYAPFQIRVNSIAPGFVETKLTDRIVRFPPLRKMLLDRTPLGRFGTPEDIAHAVHFLASDEAAFITGAELTVDGGMTASG